MNRQSHSILLRVAGAALASQLWAAGTHALAQQPAPPGEGLSLGEGDTLRAAVTALAPPHPRLRLTKMERVGPRAARDEDEWDTLSLREELAAASATQAFLERLTRLGHHASLLLRAAHSVVSLADAPNRALCRVTGADRARLDLRRRRVLFTWYVSW
jgi:hypothetical protein